MFLEFVDRPAQHRVIGGARGGEAQGRVPGRNRGLGLVEQGLVQFFAGAQPGKGDGDVAFGGQPGEADHLPREIDDPHRLAHIEHENLATRVAVKVFRGGCRGFEHQFDGLAHRHEKPADLGVGHGQRAAGGELAGE